MAYLKQSFNVYFHNNFCEPTDESWKPETYLKSDEFKTIKEVNKFIDLYITNKSKVINIHQYRIAFFASGYHPSLDTYKGKNNVDFGEFRIAIKYANVYSFLNNLSEPWKPKVFWSTYENIPEVFKSMILLFTNIDLNNYNLAGLSLIMKQDIVEFRWLMHTYDEEKYNKTKELIRTLINYLYVKGKCPKFVKCYDFNHNMF